MRLKEDATSFMKPAVIYGRQGDEVKIISDCGNVVIVEDIKGARFPVLKESVTHETLIQTQEAVPDATAHNKTIINRAPASRKKAAPIKQNSLF